MHKTALALGIFWASCLHTLAPSALAAEAPATGAPATGPPVTGAPATGAPATGAPTAFSADWQFVQAQVTPGESSADWQTVQIPHTWNAEDALDGGGQDMQSRDGYYRGPGSYKKQFPLDKSLQGKRLFIRFEGVGSVADVTFNGHHLGQHRGAFGAFCYELTEHCKFGGENELWVCADNSWREDVAPLSGDFPVFGGIYRPVTLLVKEPLCITPLDYASPGVYVTQTDVRHERATVQVVTKLDNAGAAADATVECTITDAEGKTVATQTKQQATVNGQSDVSQEFQIDQPKLWNGRQDPHLYSVKVTLKQGDQILDQSTQPLGLRYFHVDGEKGFFLNGEHYTLYGVNRHQDHAGKGWAISEEDHRQDAEMIVEIGARAVRLAHYPHSAYFYALCDKAGLLVWAEIPLVDCVTEGEAFADNAKLQLTEMVRQHYNHPSIFCWSLFNEMYHKESDDFTQLLHELNALCKAEDPTRYTVGGTNKQREVLCNVTDILAFNKYPGWYGGGPGEMSKWIELYQNLGKRRGICVSEYGAGASIRHHQQHPPKTDPKSRWHPEQWQSVVHEGNYRSIVECEYCWGSFVWNMFDFASVWRDEGDALGMNDKGLVSYDRKVRKDSFYFYKANWSEEPVLYLTSRRHNEREEAVTPVKVYSNAAEVTLRVNGQVIGTQAVDDLKIAQWAEVTLSPGENIIEVEATRDGQVLSDTCVWTLENPTLENPTPESSK